MLYTKFQDSSITSAAEQAGLCRTLGSWKHVLAALTQCFIISCFSLIDDMSNFIFKGIPLTKLILLAA